MGIFDFRDPKKRKKKGKKIAVNIACDSTSVKINDTPIEFPTTYENLKQVLGEASRIEPSEKTQNKVYLWDELGIYCSAPDPEKMLMLLFVEDSRYGLGHQPKNNFKGNVLVDGEALDKNIQNVDGGRPYMIRSVIKEDERVAIALGWNPAV